MEKEFRQVIESIVYTISTYADEMLAKRGGLEQRKENVLLKLGELEREIKQKSGAEGNDRQPH